MKQSYLNTGLVIGAMVVIVLGISALSGLTPLMVLKFAINLTIWLFFSVVFQFAGPFLAGFASRYFGIALADEHFGEREKVPGWVELLVAIALGILVSGLWIWLTPKFAVLHALSVWPGWEILRWHLGSELINYWHVAWYFFTAAIGYGMGILVRSEH